MSKSSKEIVRSFYDTDPIHDPENFLAHLHPEVTIDWNSSFGFRRKDFQDIKNLFLEMATTFVSVTSEITHIVSESNTICVRHTYFAKTIERPEKDEPLAHFMTIWELKDDKLYKAFMISQPGDLSPENLSSFSSTQ